VTRLRKTKTLWLISILGLLISGFAFAPSFENVIFEGEPPDKLHSPNPQFPIATPKPRKSGGLISRPFLFELASSDKVTGVEREARLLDRYQDILDNLTSDHHSVVTVNTSLGVATVEIDGHAFATVLPQDCPEYRARLSPERQLILEEEVAYSWANIINEDLFIQSLKRHPLYLKLYNYIAILTFWVFCLVHLTLNFISRRFARNPLWSLKLLLWVVYFTGLTTLHPSFDELADLLSRGALRPLLNFILCGVGVALLHQATQYIVHRYFSALADYEKHDTSLRAALRRQTLQQAWTFISRVTWTFLGLCLYLYSMGVDLTSFFAGAGLVGVAIGVMARDVFLDFFNGINILAEDQFGVGDWIETGTDSGQVVAFSLRSTKIRRTDGSLATLPNGDLRRVKNHSNEYSMVDFRVSVTYRTDTDYALALILDEIALLETEWQDKIAAPADALGVQELAPDGVVLRVMLKTVPLAQWETQRRLNRRVKKRFDLEGVEFAAPRRTLYVLPGTAPDASPLATTSKPPIKPVAPHEGDPVPD
jgi:small-conductance mechanosensitive channel